MGHIYEGASVVEEKDTFYSQLSLPLWLRLAKLSALFFSRFILIHVNTIEMLAVLIGKRAWVNISLLVVRENV